jgi:hypothetical protein
MAVTINASTSAGLVQTADTSGVLALQTAGTTAVTVDASQNVGIGTASPNSRMSVAVSSTSTSVLGSYANIPLLLQNTSSTDNNWTVIGVQDASGDFSSYIGTQNTSQSSNTAIMAFGTNGGSGATERMRIDSSGNLQFNSGYGSVATAYACRAWVNFNGTGTVAIRGSGNVSSITDAGVGLYDVNFTTAMPDANYAIAATAYSANSSLYAVGGQTNGQAPATTKFRVATGAGASLGADTTAGYADLPYIFASVFR